MITDILVVLLDGRRLGLPTSRIREVVRLPLVARVPGAPPLIAGIINLRGQLLTAIDLRARLGLAPHAPAVTPMAVLVEHQEHVYALVVDSVGDVVGAAADRQEPPPATLAPSWRAVTIAVQRDDSLTLLLDIDALLTPAPVSNAA